MLNQTVVAVIVALITLLALRVMLKSSSCNPPPKKLASQYDAIDDKDIDDATLENAVAKQHMSCHKNDIPRPVYLDTIQDVNRESYAVDLVNQHNSIHTLLTTEMQEVTNSTSGHKAQVKRDVRINQSLRDGYH